MSTRISKRSIMLKFLSYVKPWLKPKFLSWKEETLWRTLYECMISEDYGDKENIKNNLQELFKKTIVEGYKFFLETKKNVFKNQYVKKYARDVYEIKKSKDDMFDNIIKLEDKIFSIDTQDEILEI